GPPAPPHAAAAGRAPARAPPPAGAGRAGAGGAPARPGRPAGRRAAPRPPAPRRAPPAPRRRGRPRAPAAAPARRRGGWRTPGGPKVLDFGIARAADDRTPEEGVYGTPGWVAPERLAGEPETPGADVFAWGGLVVYAATGRGPFGTGDAAELVQRTRTAEPDLDGVPDELLPVVFRALSRDPADRPGAAEALAEVLALTGADAARGGGERERLRGLLRAAWTGFEAVRGAGPWIAAAGSAAALTGAAAVAGAGAAATGAAATGVAPAGAAGAAGGAASAGALGGTAAG